MILIITLVAISIAIWMSYEREALLFIPLVGFLIFSFPVMVVHSNLETDNIMTKEELFVAESKLENYKDLVKIETLPESYKNSLNEKIVNLEKITSQEYQEEIITDYKKSRHYLNFDMTWYNTIILSGFWFLLINPLVFNRFQKIRKKYKEYKEKLDQKIIKSKHTHQLHPLVGGWEEGDMLVIDEEESYGTYISEFISFRQDRVYIRKKDGEVTYVHPYLVKRNETFNKHRKAMYLIDQESEDVYVELHKQRAKHLTITEN